MTWTPPTPSKPPRGSSPDAEEAAARMKFSWRSFDLGPNQFCVFRIYCHQWYVILERMIPEWDASVKSGKVPDWAAQVDLMKVRIRSMEVLP